MAEVQILLLNDRFLSLNSANSVKHLGKTQMSSFFLKKIWKCTKLWLEIQGSVEILGVEQTL